MGFESAPTKKEPAKEVGIKNPHFLEMFDTPERINALFARPRELQERIKDADTIIKKLEALPKPNPDQIEALKFQRKRKTDSEQELRSVQEMVREFKAKYGFRKN